MKMPSLVPVVGNWTQTLVDIGIPFSADANGGDGWGAFIATSAINPTNWTRSYSRSAYIDSLPPRSNFDVLANATVTRIIFSNTSGNITATAVEFAASRTDTKRTVNVTKEVILAGGAIGSPHVLLHSGIGPKDVLQSAGVQLTFELPGVGQHLQDHIVSNVRCIRLSHDLTLFSRALKWSGTPPIRRQRPYTQPNFLPNGYANVSISINGITHWGTSFLQQDGSSPAFLSFINSATAYANISDLVGLGDYQSVVANIGSAIETSASSLVPSQDPTVIAGYKAIYNVTTNMMLSPVGQVELLLSLTGTAQGGAQSIAVQAALQHPLRRVNIMSSDILTLKADGE